MEKEFITSEKGRTLGTIHIEKGVQTINFPENNYGVAFKGSKREEGERVYIYFQKINLIVFQPLKIIIKQKKNYMAQ